MKGGNFMNERTNKSVFESASLIDSTSKLMSFCDVYKILLRFTRLF